MDIKILSVLEAVEFKPKVRTTAMRIYSGCPFENRHYGHLIQSSLYTVQFSYVFDDIRGMSADEIERASLLPPDENPDVAFFSRNIANQIIRDFVSVRDRIECLMVHCKMGQGRSAAVAMALNEGFNLGHNRDLLRAKYIEFNRLIYEILLRTIREA